MFEEERLQEPYSSHSVKEEKKNEPTKVVLGISVLMLILVVATVGVVLFRKNPTAPPAAPSATVRVVSVTPAPVKRPMDCGIYKVEDCSMVRVSTATLWQSVEDPEWTLDCQVKGKATYVERVGQEAVFDVCGCKCEKKK